MSRKLTFFLLGALATILFAVPTNALEVNDFVRKAVPHRVMKGQVKKFDKQHSVREVAQKQAAKLNVGQITAKQRKLMEKSMENNFFSRSKSARHRLPEAMGKKQAEGKFVSKLNSSRTVERVAVNHEAKRVAKAPRKNIEELEVETDENGIITSVTGAEPKYFKRSGMAYYPYNQALYSADQNGCAELMFSPDGTEVYIKDIISLYQAGTWVKGTIEGNTITVATGQPLLFNNRYETTVSLHWCSYVEGVGFNKEATESITFTVDDDVITLEGSNENLFIGVFWDDDNQFVGYGDSETVWTYDATYIPPVVLPDGVTPETWFISGKYVDDEYNEIPFTRIGQVAISGNDIYVSGISEYLPSAWIKGTISGNTVTFAKMQYLGILSTQSADYDLYMTSGDEDGNILDIVMTYDAETKTLTSTSEILVSVSNEEILFAEWYTTMVITKDASALAVGFPFVADLLNDEAAMDNFMIIDNNADDNTWMWGEAKGAYYNYSNANAADDYLAVPIKLEAGKKYAVSVLARCYSEDFPERFEVVMGKELSAESMSTVIIGPTDVVSEDAEEFTGQFSVAEDGTYFVAIHAISDADEFYLCIDQFSILKGLDNESPAFPTLAVEPGAEGALTAAVTIVAPATSIDGNALPAANLSKIELLRDGEVIATLNPAPGEVVNYADENMESGFHTYQAIPFDAVGEPGMKSEKVRVYVGQDEPKAPENLLLTEQADGKSVLFTWDKVGNVGKNGGYVNPAEVSYSVYDVEMNEFFGMMFPSLADEPVATEVDIDHYVFDMNVDEGEQEIMYKAVMTTNAASEEGEGDYDMASILVGRPYELPVIEGFEGETLHYFWNGNVGFGLSTEASDGDGVALKLYAEEEGMAYLISGKLGLKNAVNPTLLFDVKSGSNNKVLVLGSVDGAEPEKITDATVSEQYTTVQVPLKSISGGRYAQVVIASEFVVPSVKEYGDTLVIDNIRFVDFLEYDLTASVESQKSITAGQTAPVKMTVKNTGEKDALGFTVKVTAGDTELLNKTVNLALGSYEEVEFATEYPTTIFTEPGDVTVKAEVIFDQDLDQTDNVAETVITVKALTAAAPENVAATAEGSTVTVSWSAPSNGNVEVVEAFDDANVFEEFSVGGVSAEQPVGKLGDWTLYDGNSGAVYGFSGMDIPNLGNPSAWIVFNPSSPVLSKDLSEQFAPASGTQFMASFCTAEPEGNIDDTDHWLISPELPGVAQTISFKVRELTDSYGPETYEVLCSTTGTDAEDFQLVEGKMAASTEWEEVSFDLPAGAKYFAIRHTSNDVFALFVDDVKFVQGAGEVLSYNVYVNEEFLKNVEGTSTTLSDLADGEYTISVSAVYAGGKQSAPVTVSVKIGGEDAIEQLIATGKPVNIYTVDGKLVRQNVTSVEGLKAGIYVVDGKKATVK